MKRMILWMAAAGMLGAVASANAAEGFKLVVNEKCDVSVLPRAEISAMFLKKTARWSDGTPVVPVDQPNIPVRQALSRRIHDKNAVAMKSYWQQQIFAGRGIPPLELASDDLVVAYVRANPGAIGYVSETASTAGVKVLVIR